jgi:hypothetical protein
LEPYEKLDLLRIPSNWDHCEQVHERLPATAVINERDLRFSPQIDHVLQIQDGIIVDVLASHTGCHVAVGRLQEAAVPAENHVLGVPCQTLKVVRTVHNGEVVKFSIANHERTRQID